MSDVITVFQGIAECLADFTKKHRDWDKQTQPVRDATGKPVVHPRDYVRGLVLHLTPQRRENDNQIWVTHADQQLSALGLSGNVSALKNVFAVETGRDANTNITAFQLIGVQATDYDTVREKAQYYLPTLTFGLATSSIAIAGSKDNEAKGSYRFNSTTKPENVPAITAALDEQAGRIFKQAGDLNNEHICRLAFNAFKPSYMELNRTAHLRELLLKQANYKFA